MLVVRLAASLRAGWVSGRGVSGRAFCAVTTLPPPEQAAVESREQLAGHQAPAASLWKLEEHSVSRGRGEPSSSSSSPSDTHYCREAAALGASNPVMMRLRLLSVTKQRRWSGSPQDGVSAALHRQQRLQQAADRTTGFPALQTKI